MAGKQDFETRKKALVAENERQYGAEIRGKYGDQAVDDSNAKLMGMRPEDFEAAQALSLKVNELLIAAVAAGDPRGEAARALCDTHRQWLMHYWKAYSKQAHLGLGEMYAADPRFARYYDGIVPGGAVFLRDALAAYCAEN